jgi:organic radical activating enzyme
MTEITFEITDYCPHNCSYCSSNAGIDGHTYIDPKIIRDILRDKCYDRINISGGEPLAHPHFYHILNICKSRVKPRTGMVCVYTNAIECIVYNANILPGVRVEANLPLTENINKVHILKLVRQGYEAKRPEVHYSHNWDNPQCEKCGHVTVRPNGQVTETPCNKFKPHEIQPEKQRLDSEIQEVS